MSSVTTVAPPRADITALRTADLSAFRAAVDDSFVRLHVTADDPDRFRGSLRAASADGIHVSDVHATSHTVTRTADLIARGEAPAVKMSLMLAGTALLVQDGREALLRPGDFAVYDTGRPYSLMFSEDFRTVVTMFPREALSLPPATLSQLTAVRVAGESGLGAVAAPFLAQLGLHLEHVAAPCGSRLVHTALDLLTTVYTREAGIDAAAVDPRLALRRRIEEHIETHLAAPHLTPGSIAAAHFISTRHLHALFEGEATTVSALIRSRRLERCRRELIDPLLTTRSVSAIGARWGFPDAAHFSRTFKATFGRSPSEYRAAR